MGLEVEGDWAECDDRGVSQGSARVGRTSGTGAAASKVHRLSVPSTRVRVLCVGESVINHVFFHTHTQ